MENPQLLSDSADASLSNAWACFEKGQVDEAVRLARHAINLELAGNPHADASLGWFLLAAGSTEEAGSILKTSLEKHPLHAPLHWYLGLVNLHLRRRDEACQALKAAIAIDPALDEATETLAWVLGDLGKFEEATPYAKAALAKQPRVSRRAQLGWLLYSQQLWQEATLQLTLVLSHEPHRADARIQLVTAQKELGLADTALQILDEGLALTPDATEFLQQRIHLLLELHRTTDARSECHELLKLRPREGLSWYLLSLVLIQKKRPGAARRALARSQNLPPVPPEVWNQTAWLALEAGDIQEALEALDHVLTLDPDKSTSSILAASVFDASGDLAAASAHGEMAVSLATDSAVAWRTLAQVRSHQARWVDAENALHTALEKDTKNCYATYRQLGWIYLATDRPKEGVAAFSKAVEANPGDADSWYGVAEAHRISHQFPLALEAIRKALHLRTGWAAAHFAHGHILFESGRNFWPEAALELTTANALDHKKTQSYALLSRVLHLLGRDDEAIAALEDGLIVAPDAIELVKQKVHLLLDLRRTTAARTTCRNMLRKCPRDGEGWYLLARVLVQEKRLGIARRVLHRALRLPANSIDLCRKLGWLSLEVDSIPAALQAVDQAFFLGPNDVDAIVLAACVMDAAGNYAKASEYAERAIALADRSAPAWRALAQVRVHQLRHEDARSALETALALDPAGASLTHRQLGWLFRELNSFDKAAHAFRAAVGIDPQDVSSWYGLAEVYRAAGQFTDALRAIKPTLSLREDWNDQRLRGQIIHEQTYHFLNKKWSNLNGDPQPLYTPASQPLLKIASTFEPTNAPFENNGSTGQPYEYAVCSLSTKSHVPLMKTLAKSVRRHFTGQIYLLVVDSDDAELIPEGTTLVRLSDVIETSVWQEMVSRYNILELCCALKSYLMRFLARTLSCPIVYLDADTYLLGSMDALLPAQPNFSVFLTPHLLYPFSGDKHAEEIGMLLVGVYNGGMLAVGTGEDRVRFLDWWQDRVTRYVYDSREQGVFTDQKWLDLVPCFFKGVRISDAIGLNLGHWRVCSERDFSLDKSGKLTFCGSPVTLMHMSGFKSNRPDLLSQHLRPPVQQGSPLGDFLQKYALEVSQNRT